MASLKIENVGLLKYSPQKESQRIVSDIDKTPPIIVTDN
jgi:hypothetical protein